MTRMQEVTAFPTAVLIHLGTYVYRLIDPRNGETFYVGKGTGNRVFAHIRQEGDETDESLKLKRIRNIRSAGFEVAHIIHRHGLDDSTAFQVEGALLDAYPGLSNIAGGHGNSEVGAMHALEVIRKYEAPLADFQHRALLLTVNNWTGDTSLYEATRWAWKVDLAKVQQVEVILPVKHGLIIGAFVAKQWVDATEANFPGRETLPSKRGFIGEEAPQEVQRHYVGKRIPDNYFGQQTVRYTKS